MNAKCKKKDVKSISEKLGYPHNTIPKGYPNKINNEKINETIEKILDHLKSNAGVESIVLKDTAFINLGLNELNSRHSRKQSKIAFYISMLSLVIAIFAVYITWGQLQVSSNQIQYQRENNNMQYIIWEYEKMVNERLEMRDVEWRKQDLEGDVVEED